ncbi:MAG: type II toxin-antitoxin system HicA family toxin [Candidatus Bathyarchaeia archaeon]
MSKLPLLSWREVVKVLAKLGFRVARKKGSHLMLIKTSALCQFQDIER